VRGNERGQARLKRAQKILDEIGLGGERLDIFFMSGSQGHAFAIAAQTMTERIRKLGPNPLKVERMKVEEKVETVEEEEAEFRGRKKK
jgi:F420-non-reducing hydrogenase iron-sulfur subunit